jgi:hypothetical protein
MPHFGTIGDLVTGGRRIRKRYETGVIGDLVSGRRLHKLDDGDGSGDDRERLRELLQDCVASMQAAYNAAVDAQLRVLSALTPEAKAVASVVGDDAKKEYDTLLDSKFAIEKMIAELDQADARNSITKGASEDERELARLRANQNAINALPRNCITDQLRRRVGEAISWYEVRGTLA